jgi:hypothetical protein
MDIPPRPSNSLSSPTPETTAASFADTSDAEAGMRRALGLGNQPTARQYGYQTPRTSDHHAQKRRFAVDGDVPVVVLERRNQGTGVTSAPAASPPVNRLREVETALKAEQDARQRAERLLTEARAAIHDLQTKIGHANLARDEAVERANSLQSDMAALTAALNAERDARSEAEVALQLVSESEGITVRRRPMKAPATASAAPPVKRRGRPPGTVNGVRKARAAEPKPVRWW